MDDDKRTAWHFHRLYGTSGVDPKTAVVVGKGAKPALAAPGRHEAAAPLRAGTGGGINVTHTRRQIKAYNFTEADLDAVMMANVVSAISFSVGSAVLGFWVDVNKDVALLDKASPTAEALQTMVNIVGLPLIIVLFLIGGFFVWKRSTVISRVKSESENVSD
ncbi:MULTISPECIES: hypothetical protein [unclassified Shinella]|uniref:hypothetical protein n=1 Tax=unclassified Shinella TaxID=2643062 RepID=UPI0012E26425|nr:MULTISPECIES: hypothetical protein [unclassified Shinella]